MLFSCDRVPPPTQKSRIIVRIQQVMVILTFLYALFLLTSDRFTSALYFASCLLLMYSITQLSYFCCFILITLDILRLLRLFNHLAVSFQNEQFVSRIDADTIHRMAVFVFCTNCIYFNFAGYR
jgi:hypothetical protein